MVFKECIHFNSWSECKNENINLKTCPFKDLGLENSYLYKGICCKGYE